ncbi:MAG: metalloprotease PmbA [Gammaproteobacteria bacterium]|nr:metalloprotease PmbA [Gammaproteobacteria bacterium]
MINCGGGVLKDLAAKVLGLAKQSGATAAEVGVNEIAGFAASVRLGEVENVGQNHDKGMDVTVYFDQRCGSAGTTDLSLDSIELTVQKACHMAKMTAEDPCAGLADKELMAFDYEDLDLNHPWDITIDRALELAKASEAVGLAVDKRLTNSEGVEIGSQQYQLLYANTHGFIGEYKTTHHRMGCTLIAEENGDKERDYDYTVARSHEQLEDFDKVAEHAAQKAIKRLGARTIPTTNVPIIFAAKVAKGLWSSLLSAISGSQIYRQASFLQGAIGEQITPDFISLDERPHLLNMLGSAPFDAEGARTNAKFFVKNGVLQTYLLGSYSARKLNLQSTGNAGGVHNLFVSHSDNDLVAMLKMMNRGLLVTELIGQGVNIITGDYSRGACGFWVENGKIQFPVHEITIAGNLKEMYQNIIAVGNDIDTHGSLFTGSVLVGNMMVAGG